MIDLPIYDKYTDKVKDKEKTNRDDVIKVVCALINSEMMFKLVWNECVDDHNFASSEVVDECIDAALVSRAIAIVEEVNSCFDSGDK